jgi:hypothetical protein
MKDTGALDMRAIGIVESGGKHFNADGSVITSPAGAQGKYQLMPDTGKELAAKRGVEYNPADEQQNAILASDYANQLYGKYGSETLAGAAYNWGMGNVDKLIAKWATRARAKFLRLSLSASCPLKLADGWPATVKTKPVSIPSLFTKSITSPNRRLMSSVKRCAIRLTLL